eukprot:gene1132-663_t
MLQDQDRYGMQYYPTKFPESTLTLPKNATKEVNRWSPYTENGGTVAAIAGKGFVILASDTRLSGDYCIHTREDTSKIFQLTPTTYLASSGMLADRLQLQQILKYRLKWYTFNNGGRIPSTNAIAKLVFTILYQRRFFPYYAFSMIVGFDEQNHGVCYHYDVIGSTEPRLYGTSGSASSFVEPLLDCLMEKKHMNGQVPSDLSVDQTLDMLKNAFVGASERDIFTGDAVEFHIITPEGSRTEHFPLRRD